MIRSMTGYGKAGCLLPDKKLTIEIRSLNSKQLDINTRLPSLYREKEPEIRQLIASRLQRGKIECSFNIEKTDGSVSELINEPVVKSYYLQLRRLSEELGLEVLPEILSTVMRLPDVTKIEKAILEEAEWNEAKRMLQEALDQVDSYRVQEGAAIKQAFRKSVHLISEKLSVVEKHGEDRIGRIRERIGNNLLAFLKKEEIDENRFEQELILYLEKFDFSEEKARLRSHCAYFLETLEEKEAPGKKLGFISQEMGREINTLGSKANDAEIQRLVVEMKDALEQIREQVLNVL